MKTCILVSCLWFGAFAAGSHAAGPAGDANGDGKVDSADATVILQSAVSAAVLGSAEATLADLNADGQVNILDAVLVLKSAAPGTASPVAGLRAWATLRDAKADIRLLFEGSAAQISSPVQVQLRDLSGTVLGTQTVPLASSPNSKEGTAAFPFALAATPATLAQYVVDLRGDIGGVAFSEKLSLQQMIPQLAARLFGPETLLAGTQERLRVVAEEQATSLPVTGAAVDVTIEHGQSNPLPLFSGQTDERGVAEAVLTIPPAWRGDAKVMVRVSSELGTQLLQKQVKVEQGFVTLLTTDKPLYQPGQTIHVRSLTLRKPGMAPAAGQEVTFTVADSKGNKVFRKIQNISPYGVAAAEFTLAAELNLGPYTVSASLGDATTEKQVTVKRYVLPKFKVVLDSDKSYYLPGTKLQGTLAANYFFGKPVSGAAVTVSASKFDVGFEKFAEVTGATDADGNWTFELDLPSYFVGQPLQQGEAFVLLEASILDGAAHKETVSRSLPITAQELVLLALPESGRLIPGVENTVYVLTTYPNNSPARTTCQISVGGQEVSLETDVVGMGTVQFTPAGASSLLMTLHARDARGAVAEKTFTFALDTSADALLLRTDRTLYSVGDEVLVDIFGGAVGGSIFVDLLKDGQTLYSRILDPAGGRTSLVIPLAPDMSGTLCVSAYRITAKTDTIRDRKLIYVDPANQLRLSYEPDKSSYLPGEPATIRLRVQDGQNQPVTAAIGLNMVDESVFALQEMQPGMEKVYFYLEEQLRKPRYEIHGFEPGTIISQPDPAQDISRNQALGLMFASVPQAEPGTFEVSTRSSEGDAVSKALVPGLWTDLDDLVNPMLDLFKSYPTDQPEAYFAQAILQAIQRNVLTQDDAEDPWGQPYRVSYQLQPEQYAFKSAGPDERWNTPDDLSVGAAPWVLRDPLLRQNPWWNFGPIPWAGRGIDFMFDAVAAGGPPELFPPEVPPVVPSTGTSKSTQTPYLRQYFPETLYSNPAIITGPDGTAEVSLTMADSITTWRLTGLASSLNGQLGSATAPVRVFQEFFVDIDLPVTLTRGDEVSVPVAIYNYLPTAQQIRLVADGGDSFALLDATEQTVNVDANQVSVAHFRVLASTVGLHKLRVTAFGSTRSDALVRSVEVVPDGSEIQVTKSGRLNGNVQHTIEIPEGAIAGASKIFVKIYPGLFSQVVEGLDSLFRMPFGCFEQTSSATYPNVLAVQYMKATGQVTPEILMKAEGFISAGYQRLLSYEVAGGGFEWFGSTPAHNVLTTYGLMEFSDMSTVWYVDPAVIRRTQDWLAADQKPDGSWVPTEGGIAEGAINRYQNDILRTTAYVAWGLEASGYSGSALDAGISYIKAQLGNAELEPETYSLALCAHALLRHPEDPLLAGLFQEFEARKKTAGDLVWWGNDAPTMTYSEGKGADVELTALLAQAYMRYGRHADTAAKALNYLITAKDPSGNFGSTQATILALKAFCMAAGGITQAPDATVHIAINGTETKQLELNDANKDLLFLVDLKDQTVPGENIVTIRLEGTGSSLFQIVGRYFIPWNTVEVPAEELISIDVTYDKTELTTSDTVRCQVAVANKRPGKAKMILVDVGIPPGFTVLTEDLDPLVGSRFQKYQVAGRQLIFYLDELSSDEPALWSYRLAAKYPIRALTPASIVYEYYTPEIRAVSPPQQLAVSE